MNAKMKVSEQCRIAVSKGKQVGMIHRNLTIIELAMRLAGWLDNVGGVTTGQVGHNSSIT